MPSSHSQQSGCPPVGLFIIDKDFNLYRAPLLCCWFYPSTVLRGSFHSPKYFSICVGHSHSYFVVYDFSLPLIPLYSKIQSKSTALCLAKQFSVLWYSRIKSDYLVMFCKGVKAVGAYMQSPKAFLSYSKLSDRLCTYQLDFHYRVIPAGE